jgi:hypothetical protein
MKALGLFIFLLGMFMFTSGWVLLDLASMPLKKDIYLLDILGFFNKMFSLDPSVASFQSVISLLFIIMGCFTCYGGSILIKYLKKESNNG